MLTQVYTTRQHHIGQVCTVLSWQVAGAEDTTTMHKVLILSIAALSVADTSKAENTCNSAVNAVPLILTGPKGPPGPPGEKGDTGSQPGGAVYTRWGRTTCPTGVNTLSTQAEQQLTTWIHGRDTICVDVNAEAIPGSSPAWIYLLRAACGVTGLPCPPYNDQMVLPCAVCTK